MAWVAILPIVTVGRFVAASLACPPSADPIRTSPCGDAACARIGAAFAITFGTARTSPAISPALASAATPIDCRVTISHLHDTLGRNSPVELRSGGMTHVTADSQCVLLRLGSLV